MINLEKILLLHHATVHNAIEKLEKNEAHIVLVTDEEQKLIGTITDGDVRRGILRGVSLNDSVLKILNYKPIVAKLGEDKSLVYSLMKQKLIWQLPILNKNDQVCDIEILYDLLPNKTKKENIVVLMAGGLSTRLRPLTNECPKPMLQVGGKPILETILTTLKQFGFHQFYISINYLAQQIVDYFGDGSKWGVTIHYLQENEQMGTAGPLSLLPKNIQKPIIVMNSDLLTRVDFNQLLSFHNEQTAKATMCVRDYTYTLPYGNCKLKDNFIVSIEEKPSFNFFINAGIYVLDPMLLQIIPQNSYLDMPSLFSLLIKLKYKAAAFPIREYWLDIGQFSDFERAHREFENAFEGILV